MIRSILNLFYGTYERSLSRDVKSGPVPEHIAIIMDGNRRFANKLGKKTNYGHTRGADITEQVIEWSYEIGVKELTIYAFSTENFNRSTDETVQLFELIGKKFDHMRESERTHEKKIRVRVIGDRTLLPEDLQESAERIEQATKDYDKFNLNVALAYGGRQDIVQAVRKMADKVLKRQLSLDDINETTIGDHFCPAEGAAVSNVDLIIRTGGNERVSNFLPWQANGNECAAYFCAPFWPEFRKIDFLRSIRIYQTRLAEQKRKEQHRTTRFLSKIRKTNKS
ncbi:Undecaprenyl pyrophosphate synthetase [Methanococcoides vulcani]|uniref:Tritrans,polycis-undecaprenyl-diphosphate synthase (geranylgeranyl-diphosphate specific) n=1 Tax=Methanococcoides vulcani TaxID=1353158 RepID=A0A1I0BHX8_9EURY|nr:polyprenyl diphosphate synthase [Methanococcoides vulcani]SET06152.1 Undecaprenyl pyrophosphate synthetase [Methanococcoides vulcani]